MKETYMYTIYTYTHTHTVCVCVCVRMCVRARARVCVCVCDVPFLVWQLKLRSDRAALIVWFWQRDKYAKTNTWSLISLKCSWLNWKMCPTLQLVDGSLVLSQLLVYVILWLAGYDGRCRKTSLLCVFVLWRRTWRFQRHSNVLRLCVLRIEVFWRWTDYGRRTLKVYHTYEMAWINSLQLALIIFKFFGWEPGQLSWYSD